MAVASEETTSICSHCDRAIPSSNIDLHCVHCLRNLEKCKVCGDMVPRKHADEHYLSTHAPVVLGIIYLMLVVSKCGPHFRMEVACSFCSETMERDILDVHKGENCPQRIVTCEYCEFPLPAIDLFEHQEVCGNRTEYCHLCSRYIRLRDRYVHETTCNGIAESMVGSSREARAGAEDEPRRQRRAAAPTPLPRKHLLFTIAITGIAFILGSFFFQKKSDTSPVN